MLDKKYSEFLSWNIYQIYPRSFCDTNGDGIGDIGGIISKLDYLKELGINAVWLCPCYKTENHDNGYDITDYCSVNPEFGTIDDIKMLIEQMHIRDMKLIMDLVPNHTSDKHEWFLESKSSRDNSKSDWYYWFDTPPNDWQSCFGGSAWEYCKERNQYYLHSYTVGQPDLNWDNPDVRKEICKVIDFWVNLGVDGFRCDVIDQISKDFENGKNCFGKNLHSYIHQLFSRKNTLHLFTVGECWAKSIEEIKLHCGGERNELSTLFQFDHLDCGRADKFTPKADTLCTLRDVLSKWQVLTQENGILYSLFTDNHDNAPLISRIGNTDKFHYESATCIAAMTYLLKGVSFIYQGQEFGTPSPEYDDISYFNDVESLNFYDIFCKDMPKAKALDKICFGSRDNARRPIMWNDTEYGGFSNCKPWMPLHSGYKRYNLEQDINSKKSVWGFYKKLLAVKKENPALIYGDFELVSGEDDRCFIFKRKYKSDCITVICNFENEMSIDTDVKCTSIILSNYKEPDGNNYKPYEIRVYKTEGQKT